MTIELLERSKIETEITEPISPLRDGLTRSSAERLLLNAEKAWLKFLRAQNKKNEMAHHKAVRHLYANGLIQYDSYQTYDGRKEEGIPVPVWQILKSLPE
jgi:hypothetical protein